VLAEGLVTGDGAVCSFGRYWTLWLR
jgi:hypothetical protein